MLGCTSRSEKVSSEYQQHNRSKHTMRSIVALLLVLASVLAQREMEKKRSRLVVDSAPAGRGFSRHSGLSSDDSYAGWCEQRGSQEPGRSFPKQENFSFWGNRAVFTEKIAPG